MKYMDVKKRAWVKNAALIFLAVMLVLTFFSNSIMNRSLPEVSAQYTSSGTITARIRGSGTVSANESFDVKSNQTRTVSEVPVRVGDSVEIGDVLIKLTGSVSDELESAQEQLRVLERQLEEELLKVPQIGNSAADALRSVQAARNNLSDAQRALSLIQYSEADYNAAKAANDTAQANLRAAQAATGARELDLANAQIELAALGPSPDEGGTVDPDIYAAAVKKVEDAERALQQSQANLAYLNATVPAIESDFNVQDGKRREWMQQNTAVRDAQMSLDAANAIFAAAQRDDDVASALNSIALRELRREIDEKRALVDELAKGGGGSEITSLVAGVVTQVNISPGNQADADATLMVIEVVDRGYSLSFSVPSANASRVSVGDQADVDRGWWSWGEEIRATLVSIRNDPQNPATNRILHFNITGDVESGDQLNLVLSQRSENYSVIVPNSAIRTDTNGTFVLVVVSRSSPLRTRYIATRVDVNVITSDDTNTAVSGGLSSWGDFVITNASAPIEPGSQVRLVDNP